MKLKTFIEKVLAECEYGEIAFDINLYSDGSIADYETGNRVKFTLVKLSPKRKKEAIYSILNIPK